MRTIVIVSFGILIIWQLKAVSQPDKTAGIDVAFVTLTGTGRLPESLTVRPGTLIDDKQRGPVIAAFALRETVTNETVSSLHVRGPLSQPLFAAISQLRAVPFKNNDAPYEIVPYGTGVEVSAESQADGKIILNVRYRHSEPDPTVSVTLMGVTIPGLRKRNMETVLHMEEGKTYALVAEAMHLSPQVAGWSAVLISASRVNLTPFEPGSAR